MIYNRRRAYVDYVLEIRADNAKAADFILYRIGGEGSFKPSPVTVAATGHSIPRALTMVNRWIRQTNGRKHKPT